MLLKTEAVSDVTEVFWGFECIQMCCVIRNSFKLNFSPIYLFIYLCDLSIFYMFRISELLCSYPIPCMCMCVYAFSSHFHSVFLMKQIWMLCRSMSWSIRECRWYCLRSFFDSLDVKIPMFLHSLFFLIFVGYFT